MSSRTLLELEIPVQNKQEILEQIEKYIKRPSGFFHIVSLNPENIILSREDKTFRNVIQTAQIKLIDGIGVILAARILGFRVGERITGVGLMEELMKMAKRERLRVLLLGGQGNLALRLAQCYQILLGQAKIRGIEGIKNIEKPTSVEEKQVFSIVTKLKPHMLFVSFGSPQQELWLDRHKSKLQGIVCMGVGGAFDYLAGKVMRAPHLIRRLGLEWFFRLIAQPRRWRRQLRLIKFLWLVLLQRYEHKSY
ncbi:WecB/TagA/CpsF family glycosyltransferase [Candidatus Roizmanbacteria bacterium]|nr:WecB/TagA/CpsF family glycosyltransferase [Candidatus Roizmanbacteria bacterium]